MPVEILFTFGFHLPDFRIKTLIQSIDSFGEEELIPMSVLKQSLMKESGNRFATYILLMNVMNP